MSPLLTGVIASGISGHLTPPWEPQGAYDALSTVTVPSGGVASVTFAGIPTGYKHLQVRGIVLSSSPNNGVVARFNSDSSANYSIHGLEGNGLSAPTAYGTANTQLINIGYTGDATYPGTFVCDILDYSDTTKSKTTRAISGNDANATGTRYITLLSGRYAPLTAINSITLTHGAAVNFNQHSQFTLYGVK